MTRINCIPVTELNNKMLLSEYRELPRIFSWLEKVIEKNNKPKIPAHYVLGTGHMSFFADKLFYLSNRHQKIIDECLERGFKIKNVCPLWYEYGYLPNQYWNDWTPDQAAMTLNRERINERLGQMKRK